MDKNYSIRTATRAEIDIAVQWAAKEGWNPGLHDADCYSVADPNGFLVGLLGDEPIATISAIAYGRTFGFIGFYIVKPEYRGKGYGMEIWRAAMKRLEGRNIGLDGVIAQQENYRKSGFVLAYRNVRYEGKGGGTPPRDGEIARLSDLRLETVRNYDGPFFPEDRWAFMESWIRQPESDALAIMRDGKLAGYGVMRACRSGRKIGPLFADDPELAEALFLALRSRAGADEPVYLDTPEVNEAAVSLAERHGMKVVFETARMYTGEEPAIPLSRLFGVASFEVG